MTYGYAQTRLLVERELKAQAKFTLADDDQPLNVPLILGPVGAGKSSIARELAKKNDLMLLAINSGENSDATNLSGVPVPSMIRSLIKKGTEEEKKDARHAYMEWVLNYYAALACEQPGMLFFDDLDKAPAAIQGAMLGVTAERRFRDRSLHKGTLIIGAGNRIDDDKYANEISESLRTRMTVIEMIPDVVSFSQYGAESKRIHPTVIGYLQFRPDHLHEWKEGVFRFPTPRGWREVSQQFEMFPNPVENVFGGPGAGDNWKGIVSRKCGPHIAADFWAWYQIIANVDVQGILDGTAKAFAHLPSEANKRRMGQYAAVFAVAHELNTKGVKKSYVGLEQFVEDLDPEMRVALVVQVSRSERARISSMFERVGDLMMSDIVPATDPGKHVLVPPKKAN